MQNRGQYDYRKASILELADTLVHELGHVLNIVQGLGSSSIITDVNPDGSSNPKAQHANHFVLADCVNEMSRLLHTVTAEDE